MLFRSFRSAQAEAALSANHYAALLRFFDGPRKAGRFGPADDQAYLEAWSQPGALTGGLNYYRASKLGPGSPTTGTGAPIDPGAYRVPVPTLVIWGMKDDALLPQNLDGLETYVPDLTVERIAEGSHWVVHEHPEQVAALMRRFMARR